MPHSTGLRGGTTPRARLDGLRHDVRHACRALLHARGFALWVIGSLAAGMAVAIAALAFLNTLVYGTFPGLTDQNRLVRVTLTRDCGRPDCWIRMSSPDDYAALREELTGLQGLTAYALGTIAVGLPEARSMYGALASANYFEVLGVRPTIGRTLQAGDDEARAAVAVVAHGVWMRDFEGDPSAIGRSIRVGDTSVEIVGVASEGFKGIDRRPGTRFRGPDIWLPLWMADDVLPLTPPERRRGARDLSFAGRLRDGASLSEVQAEASVLAPRLASERSGSSAGRANVVRLWRGNPEHRTLSVLLVLPIPILVLAIACVNAANLMLAHGSRRQREIAIRLAIGAGRGRIISQLLVESAVLALAATAVALPIAWAALKLVDTPLNLPIPFDATVLAQTVLTAMLTTMAFGLAPALRISAQRPSSALGSAGGNDALPRQSRMRRALVIAQVALSLGLMATAWQLVATVQAQAVSGGMPADRLLIARFDLRPLRMSPIEQAQFYEALAAGARRLNGIEAAGLARHASVWTFGQGTAGGSIRVWREQDRPDEGRVTLGGYAGGDLFDALGLRLLQGRIFTGGDRQGRPQAAVVNRPFAEAMGGPALGSTIQVAPREGDFASSIAVRIVGIIEPTVEPRHSPDERPAQKVYLPSPIEPEPALALYARTAATASAAGPALREYVARLDPRVPILEMGSLVEMHERSFGPQLWLARAAAALGFVGLLLGTAGLYGVSSFVVALRVREIAIRMAIGASPRAILTMILGGAMRLAAAGLVAGGAAAAVASRIIQAEYHGIAGLDPAAFGGSAALFVAAMLLAGALPAVRASRVDPVATLKET